MVAPITGKLRRHFVRNVSASMAIGTMFGYGWWNLHLHRIKTRDEFYKNLEDQRAKGLLD